MRLCGNIPVNGTDGDGVLTMIFALVFGSMGLVIGLKQGRLWTSIVGLVLAVLTVLTSAYDAANISGVFSRDVGSQYVSVGSGLWLVLVGGLAAMGVAIAAMAKRSPRT